MKRKDCGFELFPKLPGPAKIKLVPLTKKQKKALKPLLSKTQLIRSLNKLNLNQ